MRSRFLCRRKRRRRQFLDGRVGERHVLTDRDRVRPNEPVRGECAGDGELQFLRYLDGQRRYDIQLRALHGADGDRGHASDRHRDVRAGPNQVRLHDGHREPHINYHVGQGLMQSERLAVADPRHFLSSDLAVFGEYSGDREF